MITIFITALIFWGLFYLTYKSGYRVGKVHENRRCKDIVMGESVLHGEPPEEIATMIKLNPVKSCKIYCEVLKNSIVSKLHL